jgi:ABC-type multidrug transport system fused ATPase/permease subunit
MFYDPINRLHGLNQMIQSGRAAAERVFRILDTPVETEPVTAMQLPARKGGGRRVAFENVSFSYRDDVPVLKNITLAAEPGQTVALVGPTGAGKSSLINLIPRFYVPNKGAVRIDGVPNDQLSLAELRAEVGIVTQESFLFNDTVLNNLRFGRPNATLDEIEFALKAANAWDFVQRMPEKLESVVGERGVRLSVGEKQRISIARALLKDPPILILDEATASVDTQTERLIQEALERLMSERTSFVIAHRLSTVRNADVICVLQHGEILEQGDHATLFAKGGLYAKLCAIQHGHETIEEAFERI